MPRPWSTSLREGVVHLSKSDPVLHPLIRHHGAPTIKPHTNYYQELVESIISQQLSVKAAATITRRFVDLFGGQFPAPEQILGTSVAKLRKVGMSNAKANYVRDLAAHIQNNELKVSQLPKLSNAEVIKQLTAVKGIGEWTAHMFLMFCLGRLDVLASGDLGIRNGVMRLYKLEQLPDRAAIEQIATKYRWHPYETIACWYIWQALDNQPATAAAIEVSSQ